MQYAQRHVIIVAQYLQLPRKLIRSSRSFSATAKPLVFNLF